MQDILDTGYRLWFVICELCRLMAFLVLMEVYASVCLKFMEAALRLFTVFVSLVFLPPFTVLYQFCFIF